MPWRALRQFGQRLLCGVAALGVVWATPHVAYGEPLPGSAQPQFQRAFNSWLDDDEAQAIPALAGLAQDGNGAARALLGLIDKTSALQGPWITALSRADRILALRAPGGLSGRNWMTLAAPDSAYARLWTLLWQLDGGLEIAQAFVALDDPRAVNEALVTLASRREGGFPADVLGADWFPASLSYLVEGWPDVAGAAGAPHPGDPQQRMAGHAINDGDLMDWLAQSALAVPLRQVCAVECPDQPAACSLALYQGLGSYPALAVTGSPVAQLVPTEDFFKTPRGRASLARRIMLMRSARMREADLVRLGDVSSCASEWLRGEYGRYAYSLPTVPLPVD
ncbi:hypothetical protein [Roseinatronobacter sp. NSM]|uniref:hypothetical protein n=1 Tax=Roseinatronobacter sp. NSM TaxID=3457785 RepID=UPI004035870F